MISKEYTGPDYIGNGAASKALAARIKAYWTERGFDYEIRVFHKDHGYEIRSNIDPTKVKRYRESRLEEDYTIV